MPANTPQPFRDPLHQPEDPVSYADPIPATTKSSRKIPKKLSLIILGLVLLAGLGFVMVKTLGQKKSQEPTPDSSNKSTPSEVRPSSEQDVPEAGSTKTYENGFLGVKLTYPDTWIATEPESKDSVRLESPTFSYQTVNGTETTGNFRIYIRKGARTADGKYIGRGVAMKPSEKLTYTNPAVGQRTETNLTLFGLDTPDNFAFFLIAGNYSLNKGDTLGPNYGKEAETYIIAGGFSSAELKDDLATHQVLTELLETSNAYKQAVEILKSLQLR